MAFTFEISWPHVFGGINSESLHADINTILDDDDDDDDIND